MVPACSTASAVLSRPGARHRGRITVAPRKTTAAKSAFPVGTHAKLRRRRVAAVEGDGATTANAECDDDEEIPDIEIPERPDHVRLVDGFLPAADAGALRAVAEVRGDEQLGLLADGHLHHAIVPTADDLADADLEGEGLVALVRRVELPPGGPA